MKFLPSFSIRRRHTLILLLISGAALLLGCIAFKSCEIYGSRHGPVSRIETFPGLTAHHSDGLSFNYREFALTTVGVFAAAALSAFGLWAGIQPEVPEASPELEERKQAEAAVRRMETLYRQAISGADAVPYAYDYRTRTYVFMGEGIEKLIGYGSGEITPGLWQQITLESVMLGETSGLPKAEAARRVLSGEIRNWRCDMRVRARNGTVRWIADVSVQKLDPSGHPLGSIGILQDITERKEAEQALRVEEERMRLIIDQAFDAVITTDVHATILGWNRQAQTSLGWEAGEVLGRNLLETVVPPHRRAKRRSDFEQFRATAEWADRNCLIETTALDRTGREVPVEVTTTPIKLGQSHIITIFLRDITQRKQAEAELRKLHEELFLASRQAGMAEVATGVLHNVGNVLNSVNVSATLAEEQVKRSRASDVARVAALLREHAADLGAFLTHDPKGRLVPEFLGQLAERLGAEQDELLQELAGLRKNVEHIKDIVAMQQSYARASGMIENVDVAELVEDTLRLNEPALERHHVRIVREFEPVPRIATDRHKVLQILINLVRNAKYACSESEREDKQIRVRLARGGDQVLLSIIDNGVGIPAENLVRIFNHGFTTRANGHGFGLHSAALAARDLGGNLTAHSDGPGQGARFTLELPMGRSALDTPDSQPPAVSEKPVN